MRTEAQSYNSKMHRTMSNEGSTERYDPGEQRWIVLKKNRTKDAPKSPKSPKNKKFKMRRVGPRWKGMVQKSSAG